MSISAMKFSVAFALFWAACTIYLYSDRSSSLTEAVPRLSPEVFSGRTTYSFEEKPLRPLLMVPGPTEFDNDVLKQMEATGLSHVDKEFIDIFGATLLSLKKVFMAEHSEPFVVAGSGTLGWDSAAANLVETGDEVLSIVTGYFGEGLADCLASYGAHVTRLRCEAGDVPSWDAVETALRQAPRTLKLVAVTHVDTSTGVRVDLRQLAALAQRWQPQALLVVDGVCSVAGEELRTDEWGLDVVLTASQKALGVPPGLAVIMVGPRALQARRDRKQSIGAYYVDWLRWLPVMEAYEEYRPRYFATPAIQLVMALNVSVSQILQGGGMPQRVEEHRAAANRFRAAMKDLKLEFFTKSYAASGDAGTDGYTSNANANVNTSTSALNIMAHTLSTIRYPVNINGSQLLPAIRRRGVEVAGGLLPGYKDQYFRVGHMGVATRKPEFYIEKTIQAIREGLEDCGYAVE